MKKIITICVFLLFFLESHAQLSYTKPIKTNPECFLEIMSTFQSDVFYIKTKYNDIFVKQGIEIIEPKQDSLRYPFIKFNTNISQKTNNNRNISSYIFGDIDTNDTKEIIITIEEVIEKGNFQLEFLHSSKLYTPKYHISEDGGINYSQILLSDISDYLPTHIKIIFQPNSREDIREIIKIKKLQLLRKDKLWEISPNKYGEKITIYGGNVCGNTRRSVEVLTKDTSPIKNIINYFEDNEAYKKYQLDTDKDSIKDLYDNCIFVKNTDQKDINQNWVGDACEFDSDNDTVPDEIDNCRNIENLDQADDDHDSIGNACDNCNIYNPSQIDSNNNDIGDICDSQKAFLNNNDDDNDGILNRLDNCQDIANPEQEDDDNDGIGDLCDNCKFFQNSDQSDLNENGIGDICEDSDNDGIDSITDNCINIPNTDQKDDDNDGIGNLCDDNDNDAVIFIEDNCPHTYNPNQQDTDGDHIGDACDEKDNRFLEANKNIFILLMILLILGFITAIYMMIRKLQK